MNEKKGKVASRVSMPSILDKELEDRSADAFGHQDYADALRDLIESPTNKPPFSVGLLGPWGTGKSSIKSLYRRDLEEDKTGLVGGRRADRIHVITFNAWRFGGEQDLKRALLREAFKQLGGDEAALRRALFAQVNNVTHQRRSFGDWFGEAFGQILGAAIILVIILLAVFLIALGYVNLTGLTEQYSLAAIFGGAIVLAGWFGKTIVDLRVRSPAWFLPQTSVSFPATSAEEYERLLTDQIEVFRRNVGRKCERLVVFVDDLDRLSAPEMVTGLDAIRTFLELPFNTSENEFGVVFVISCDEDKIAEAIKRRNGLGSPDLPGAVFSRGDARRYLDRLFQYRLEIPQFPKLDMRDFALKKLQGIESVATDLKTRKVDLEDVIDRLIHVDVQSPRNAIQLLNAFIQSWWVGSLRERNGVGSSAPGALHKGAVTEHPLSLAALCVLRVDFPDFYDAVQNRPEIIQEFRNAVFGGKPLTELAPQARELLSEFLVADKNGELTSEVRVDHRKLRRYLSSLVDLRWPVVLQPLLRLAEDPITRKFGDRAAAVFDSLISGDVVGVLEAFGRHLDDKPLGDEDAVLLEDFGEALPQETEARRTNAARVLAALVDRIPQGRKRRILSPLIRQMAALKAVRMNIQPGRARQIIVGASADDRRDVAERFIADILSLNPLDWRLATGGEPNLGEVTGAAKDTVGLALEVKETDGLSTVADTMLRQWLLKREIRLENESQTLPFSDLEEWIDEHSSILPGDLETEYSDQAIGEFEQATTTPRFTEKVLPRLSVIFAGTAKLGEEERQVLWSQLTRLVAVRSQAAAEFAWGDAARYSDLAGAEERRAFLVAFATRLCNEIEDDENWPLDWSDGSTKFNDLIAEWRADIDAETANELERLVLLWAKDTVREKYALRALDVLKDQAKESWDTIISSLTKMDMSVRPSAVSGYLGRNFDATEQAGKSQLVTKMDALINANGSDEKSVVGYDTLVKSMSDTSWSEAPLKDHLVRLLDRINAMHNNPDYLGQLLPIAASIFRFSPVGKVGQVLISLLTNAVGTPDAYIAVHRCMKESWPEPNPQIGDYNPDDIVARACQFIREKSGTNGIGDVYESVCDLAKRGISSTASNQGVADVTSTVWRMAPQHVSALAGFVATILTPTSVAEVLTGTQSPDLDRGDLSMLLTAVSKAFDRDQRSGTAQLVLSSAPEPLFENLDGAFKCWILAVEEDDPGILIDLLADDSLNDDQANRVLVLISDSTLAVDSPSSIEAVLKDTARPKTRSALIERLAGIAYACGSDSAKSKLAEHLMGGLPALPEDDLYTVARQIGDLGGGSALERNDGILSTLDSDQIDAISKAFPASRRFRAVAKNLREKDK
ncbi:P-loop NTPase fold protein [Allopusillimonas ginsengisoli]|uniref:P-loop NTPase fold protein n=1 Tax=Allopusillimonas ginsengisoli TaxID=453575 RepID=UPI00101F417B|nr:P-loop NTPase fold protein [Allopusillimonas ginsengisoli]TEA70172.1 hypothetical protein ERE07_21000 [Allopusillimonas ginsengisoli]